MKSVLIDIQPPMMVHGLGKGVVVNDLHSVPFWFLWWGALKMEGRGDMKVWMTGPAAYVDDGMWRI